LAIDFSVLDAVGKPWTLSDQLDAAAVITFHRGDF
jgi:peroxiredoxin